MRALAILGFVALSLAVSAEASARCETVTSPVFGEVTVDGSHYSATAGGLVMTDEATGAQRVRTACDGLAGTYIQAIAVQPDGRLTLAIRGKGLWSVDRETGEQERLCEDDRLRWPTSLAWFDGALWVGTVQKGLWRLDDVGQRVRLTQPARRFRVRRVSSLVAGPKGGLLVGRDLGGLWRVERTGRSKRLLKGSVQGISVTDGQIVVDQGARRCLLTGRRRCRTLVTTVQDRSVKPGALPSAHFTSLLVHPDPSGTPRVWAGTFDHGVVYRDEGGQWRRPEGAGEPPRFVNTLAAQGDTVWAGTATGAFRLQDGQWTRYGEDQGLPSDHVNAVHVAEDDTVWFATSRGLAHWDDQGLRTWGAREGLPYRIVYSVATRNEQVLVGTSYGLGIFDGSTWTTVRMGPSGLSDDWVNAVGFRADGTPLAGTYDAGVDALSGTAPEPVPGLGRLWVNPGGLFPVAALGGVFVTTLGDGLWFWPDDGEPRRVARTSSLPSDDVTAVTVHAGELWVATRGGLARLPVAELTGQ